VGGKEDQAAKGRAQRETQKSDGQKTREGLNRWFAEQQENDRRRR
jgi:hypothetical protein